MDLEKEIEQIKQRNKKVELDKAWETSWTRRICIMILTYIVVIIYSHLIQNTNNITQSGIITNASQQNINTENNQINNNNIIN